MYKNLKDALNEKNITIKEYASYLGVSEKTAQNKINEVTEFTFPEVKKTKKYIFPEYDMNFLFKSDKTG